MLELVNEYNWLLLTNVNLDDEKMIYNIDKIAVSLSNLLKNQDSRCYCYKDKKRFQFHCYLQNDTILFIIRQMELKSKMLYM